MLIGVLAAAAMVASGTRPALRQSDFKDIVLALHNKERGAVGSAPLGWSDRLARDARAWADRLAASGTLRHDPANHDEGENLWMGTRGAFRVQDMISDWTREKAALRHARSWQDDYMRFGHYAQMIWARTRAVGCARAQDAHSEYLVCRYDPPGNVWNESPYGDRAHLSYNSPSQ